MSLKLSDHPRTKKCKKKGKKVFHIQGKLRNAPCSCGGTANQHLVYHPGMESWFFYAHWRFHIEKNWLTTLYYISLQVVELCFCFCYKQRDQFRNIFHTRSLGKPEERTAPTIVQISKPCQSSDMQSLQRSHLLETVKSGSLLHPLSQPLQKGNLTT